MWFRGRLPCGSFRKLGIPYFRAVIVRILLSRVLYWGPLSSETPKYYGFGGLFSIMTNPPTVDDTNPALP